VSVVSVVSATEAPPPAAVSCSTPAVLFSLMSLLLSVRVAAAGSRLGTAGSGLLAGLLRSASGLLRPLLRLRLLALPGDHALALELLGHLGVVGPLPDLLVGVDRLASLAAAVLHRLLRGRARGGHPSDDVELLAHRPQVRREPVDEDTDGEEDTGDGEDDREEVEHHLLLLGD